MKALHRGLGALLLMGAAAVTQLGAAGTSEPAGGAAGGVTSIDVSLFNRVGDSSELPTWTGPQMKLRVWQGHGTGGAARVVAPNDVVSPEVKRVFGIELDKDKSFDNSGQDLPSKLAVLAATGDFPEIGYNVEDKDLISAGKLWDLTDLIPRYAPHFYKLAMENSPRAWAKGWAGTGRHYSVPMLYNNDATSMLSLYPDLDLKKYQYIAAPMDHQGWLCNVWVRDDILKLVYPGAKSQKEIEDRYVQNGAFKREEIFDVPIHSRDDAIRFFYDVARVIKDRGITEGGKPVYATFVFSGQDNWALLAWLNTLMRGALTWNYFTFFNPVSRQVELGYRQPWFIEDMKLYNRFVRDGVAPASCLIENNDIFTNRLNNGEYAISYAWLQPDRAKAKAAGKPWNWRKVYFDIPQDTTKMVFARTEPSGVEEVSIFKDKVDEQGVIRILQWLDFMSTPAGMKLACWGPRTAGLWTEAGGVRRFANKEAEDGLVFDRPNGAEEKFNLTSTRDAKYQEVPAWPGMTIGVKAGGIYNPKYVYDMSGAARQPANADQFFATGIYGQPRMSARPIITTADIWVFPGELPSFKAFWDVRGTGFEPLMTRCFAAASDEEFQAAYDKMVQFAEEHQLTDAALQEAQKLLQTKYPDDWAVYLEEAARIKR